MSVSFESNGFLAPGLHPMFADEFIDTFCAGSRRKYTKAIVNIFDFARYNGATRIIVGGSFVSKKEDPSDLDCMIVFYNERQIPTFVDCAQMDELSYDILYGSEDQPRSIDTFIHLMASKQTYGEKVGVVEVLLDDRRNPWKIVFQPSEAEMEIISRVYSERTFIERNKRRGVLIAVHGINTHAKWLSNLVPALNSQGWIVAPFIYDNPVTLLASPAQRKKVIEEFREWAYEIRNRYSENGNRISALGHSFGTYILAKYFDGYRSEEFAPISLDSLVLTGSIINPSFDWNALIPFKVNNVLNIVAPGDEAVRFMPAGDWKKIIGMDPLCGKGAIDGIAKTSDKVVNRQIEILTHTNIFKDDFIQRILLPYINANCNSGWLDSHEKIMKEAAEDLTR